jgi:hypothetical protein
MAFLLLLFNCFTTAVSETEIILKCPIRRHLEDKEACCKDPECENNIDSLKFHPPSVVVEPLGHTQGLKLD